MARTSAVLTIELGWPDVSPQPLSSRGEAKYWRAVWLIRPLSASMPSLIATLMPAYLLDTYTERACHTGGNSECQLGLALFRHQELFLARVSQVARLEQYRRNGCPVQS